MRSLPPLAGSEAQLRQEGRKGEGHKEERSVAVRSTAPAHSLPVPLTARGENAVAVGPTEAVVQEVRVVVLELNRAFLPADDLLSEKKIPRMKKQQQ